MLCVLFRANIELTFKYASFNPYNIYFYTYPKALSGVLPLTDVHECLCDILVLFEVGREFGRLSLQVGPLQFDTALCVPVKHHLVL